MGLEEFTGDLIFALPLLMLLSIPAAALIEPNDVSGRPFRILVPRAMPRAGREGNFGGAVFSLSSSSSLIFILPLIRLVDSDLARLRLPPVAKRARALTEAPELLPLLELPPDDLESGVALLADDDIAPAECGELQLLVTAFLAAAPRVVEERFSREMRTVPVAVCSHLLLLLPAAFLLLTIETPREDGAVAPSVGDAIILGWGFDGS